MLVDLRRRVSMQEARIVELERLQDRARSAVSLSERASNGHVHRGSLPNSEDHTTPFPNPNTPLPQQTPSFSMDTLDLGPPTETLRTLGALSKAQAQAPPALQPHSKYDPVLHGVVSAHDAQKAFNIFFDYCQPLAPVLNEKLRYAGPSLRVSNSILFLAICSIGARFWQDNVSHSATDQGFHPSFFDLTDMLDGAISRLLLRPSPSDANLDSIRVLLLYAQWMPCSREGEDAGTQKGANTHRSFRSRYNEVSAWAVLGLAIRYAVFLGLDRAAIAPFHGPAKSISEDDASRLRVWLNLITVSLFTIIRLHDWNFSCLSFGDIGLLFIATTLEFQLSRRMLTRSCSAIAI